MAQVMRVTGAWTRLLQDWFDANAITAPELRGALSRWSQHETVPIPIWRELLARGLALAPEKTAPELAVGACVTPAHVGVMAYLVLASDTLGEALLAYQRYERLFYGINLAEVEAVGEDVEIRWPKAEPPLGQRADGVSIAALVTFMRRQMDNPPPPSRVCFTGSLSLAAQSAYEAFFNCPVTTEDSHVRVRFPVAQLTKPMPRRDPTLKALLDQQAQALLRALPARTELDSALHQVLPRLLSDGQANLEQAARVMHLSPRTLQRRLAERGLSWQEWLDSSREELATHYLQDPGLALSDIALLLGYSEQSAFNRAYRRWTGTTPAKARKHWTQQNGASISSST